MYRTILVPFDGSAGAWQALRTALRLAREASAALTLLSVEERLPHFAAAVGEIEEEKELENHYFARVQQEAVALARAHGVEPATAIRAGPAAHVIVRYAEEQGCDLIVIGASGHSGVWGRLLGATTDRVVDHAPCDVLVARAAHALA